MSKVLRFHKYPSFGENRKYIMSVEIFLLVSYISKCNIEKFLTQNFDTFLKMNRYRNDVKNKNALLRVVKGKVQMHILKI